MSARSKGSASFAAGWLGLFALALVFYASLTHDAAFLSGNDASRLAQIESIVDHGEGNIDASRYRWTKDRVTIDGKDYSNKPPLLGLLGAAVYAVVKPVGGIGFDVNEPATIYWLTLIVIGATSAALVATFHRALRVYDSLPASARVWTTLALAAGSLLTSFSGTFNNHTIAAGLIFFACHAAWSGRPIGAGVALALSVAIDIVPGLVFLPVVAWIVIDTAGRAGLIRYAACLAGGAVVFVAANLAVVGSALPPKWVAGGVDHSSRFASSVAGVLLPERWTYPLEALVGWHGFLTITPVIVIGAVGLVRAVRGGGPLRPRWCALLAAACGVMIAGHTLFVGSYGGWSWGFRYLIPIVPVMLFFAPPVFARLGPWLSAAIVSVSVLLALIGAYNPWPPAYEQKSDQDPVAALVSNPVAGNLSAWLHERFPDRPLPTRLGSWLLGRDVAARNRYLYLFYLSKGDLTTAIDHCRRATVRRPNDPAAWYQLGLALTENERGPEAIAPLGRAVALARDDAEARYLLGTNLEATGATDEAETQFRLALALDPEHSAAHNNLAIILAGRGDLRQARVHFEAALAGDPDDERIRRNLEQLRAALGEAE